jgi:arylsulfatase A-like enzyme
VRLLDDAVGRVLEALERRGFLENCLLVFTSDHGEMLGSHRLFQKMCMYEEALRVPMLVRAPGRGGAGRREALTQHLDLAATICDWAGVAPPATNRGSSLRGLVERSSGTGRSEVFAEFNGNSGRGFQQRALVTPDWKYIHNHGHAPELYRRADDPLEAHNLCAEEKPPAEAERLRARLAGWMGETGDYLKI